MKFVGLERFAGRSSLAPRDRDGAGGEHRFAFVDFLRAVAILLVFVRHATEVFLPFGHGGRLVYLMADRLNFGELGVVVFFAISGFLIPSSLRGGTAEGSVRYVLSRVFRLYPAFVVSVIPSAASHFWLQDKEFPWHDVWLNCTIVPRLFGARLANGAYWTLEVEIAFYLLCLLLFVGGVVRDAFVLAAVCLAAYLVFESSQQVFFSGLFNPILSGPAFFFNLNIAVMFWAAVVRHWWEGRQLRVASAAICWFFAFFWIIWHPALYVLALLRHRAGEIDTNMLTAYGGGVAIFLAAVLHGGLRFSPMLWIGRISYSLYLFHGVVIHLLQRLLILHPAWQGHHTGIYELMALVASLAVAHVSFHAIETPGIRLGRAVTRRALVFAGRVGARHRARGGHFGRLAGVLLARPAQGESGIRASHAEAGVTAPSDCGVLPTG